MQTAQGALAQAQAAAQSLKDSVVGAAHAASDAAMHPGATAASLKDSVVGAAHAASDAAMHPIATAQAAAQAAKEKVISYMPTKLVGGQTVSDPELTALVDALPYTEVEQPFVKLTSGRLMPMIGLGTWRATGDDAYNAVRAALKGGYRHIDTAKIYNNEEEIGRALQSIFAEGRIKREDVHVTSKLWNTDHADPEAHLRASLAKLGLDFLDLWLMHWPVGPAGSADPATHGIAAVEPPIEETFKKMHACVEKGLVRSIGVANFSVSKLEYLLEKTGNLVPSVNQVEMHPYLRNDALHEFCKSRLIHNTAYSPLGSQPKDAQTAPGAEPVRRPLEDPEVIAIAGAHGVSPGSVLIRWGLQRGCSVVPKSRNVDRIQANLKEVLSFDLSEPEMARLSSFEYQHRMVEADIFLKDDATWPYHSLGDVWE